MPGDSRLKRSLPYAAVGLAAAYLYYIAAQFQFHARAGTLGPDFWPKAILVLLLAACAYEIIRIIVMGERAREGSGVLEDLVMESSAQHTGEEPAAAPVENHPWLLLAGMLVTLAYVAAVQRLGFFLATVVYLALFMVIGRYRRWGVIAAMSLAGSLVMLFIFMKLVYVSLPIGVEPFAQVTLALMKLMGIR